MGPKPTWQKTPKPTKEPKTPRPTWAKTPRPTKKMDWPSKKMTEEPTKYGHGHGQWQKDQMKKDAYAAYYRDPYERRYSMQYNGDEEMKKNADAAYYRDPYERKYSMRYAEPDHDYKGWNTDKPTEPKYDDKHWQKTPCPTKWKKEKTPRPTWNKTPHPTKEPKTPRPTWAKTPKPTEHKSNGQWEKENDYRYKEEMKKAADASYYRDPYAREYSMQYDQMKKMADAAYHDPYADYGRKYSMHYGDDKEMKENADAAYYHDPYERRYD